MISRSLKHFLKTYPLVIEPNIPHDVYDCRIKMGLRQSELVNYLGLGNVSTISNYETNESHNIDKRIYSLILLASGEHPHYRLIDNKSGLDFFEHHHEIIERQPLVVYGETGSSLKNKRCRQGLKQREMSKFLGLGGSPSVSRMEKGQPHLSTQTIILWLLVTDSHPFYRLVNNKFIDNHL